MSPCSLPGGRPPRKHPRHHPEHLGFKQAGRLLLLQKARGKASHGGWKGRQLSCRWTGLLGLGPVAFPMGGGRALEFLCLGVPATHPRGVVGAEVTLPANWPFESLRVASRSRADFPVLRPRVLLRSPSPEHAGCGAAGVLTPPQPAELLREGRGLHPPAGGTCQTQEERLFPCLLAAQHLGRGDQPILHPFSRSFLSSHLWTPRCWGASADDRCGPRPLGAQRQRLLSIRKTVSLTVNAHLCQAP